MRVRRDEEAVSSTVATVLLFGGVVSIIGVMMASMMPVIEEMQGSIERNDIGSQLLLLAQRTDALAEAGMPGDTTDIDLRPLDGAFVWDETASGMWYAASWTQGHTLRTDGLLDLDGEFLVRHPQSMTTSVCLDDLRLGPARPYHYTTPAWAEQAIVTLKPGVAETLGPVDVDIGTGAPLELRAGDVVVLDPVPEVLHADAALTVLHVRGSGGAAFVEPLDADPTDGTGRSWSVPLPSGSHQVLLSTLDRSMVEWRSPTGAGTSVTASTDQMGVGHGHAMEMTFDKPGLLHFTSSAPGDLVVLVGNLSDAGRVQLNAHNGAFVGTSFLPPNAPGALVLSNPSDAAVTVTWRGDGRTVPAGASVEVAWPPNGVEGPALVDAEGSIMAAWIAGASGVRTLPASDTGGSSGALFHLMSAADLEHEIQLNGVSARFNATGTEVVLDDDGTTSTELALSVNHTLDVVGGPVRVTEVIGEHGAAFALHDGEDRCLHIGVEASGWVRLDLPWHSAEGQDLPDLHRMWRDGDHPAGIEMRIGAVVGVAEHQPIGTVYAVHLSRLQYGFASSIQGMEVAYSGGAVVTNHPEMVPLALRTPTDRGGPGPRFAATIPAMHPTTDSITGAGPMDLEVSLQNRHALASALAWEVRRGWTGPYGAAIAEAHAYALEGSADWTVYPGRLDLLTDYVGWVPDPALGTQEAVWHTGGEPIQFSLQIALLDVTLREVES